MNPGRCIHLLVAYMSDLMHHDGSKEKAQENGKRILQLQNNTSSEAHTVLRLQQ